MPIQGTQEDSADPSSSSPAGANDLQHLSFISPDFDAFKALQIEDLQPPDLTVQPLINLEACRAILSQLEFDSLKALEVQDLQPPDSTVQALLSIDPACQGTLPQGGYDATEALPVKDQEALLLGQSFDDVNECCGSQSQELLGHLQPNALSASEAFEGADFQKQDCGNQTLCTSLDFFSPEFDALEALRTKDLIPPNPRVRPLDNLNTCRRILPKEVAQAIVNIQPKPPRSLESISAQERAKARKSLILQKAVERARQVKIFDKIAQNLKNGPLGLLTECYNQQVQIKVWTRHSHGVRGSLIGFLSAFDKHFNMVLHDIDEEYSVRRWVPRLVHRRGRSIRLQRNEDLTAEEPEQSICMPKDSDITTAIEVDNLAAQLKELRLFPKLEHRRRHLNQVFLRGDSVVMVQKMTSTF